MSVYKMWTGEEAGLLREWAGKMTVAEMAARLGRSRASINSKMTDLDLWKTNAGGSVRRSWTDEENERLRQWAGKMPVNEIAARLHRSATSIRSKIQKEHLWPSRHKYRMWTDDEIEYLKQHYPNEGSRRVAAYLGRSRDCVAAMAKKQGLYIGIYLNDETIPIKLMSRAFGLNTNSGVFAKRLERDGLHVIKRKYARRYVYHVKVKAMWAYLKTHRDNWDFAALTPNALGAEPEWVHEARLKDRLNPKRRSGKTWSDAEDMLLRSLLRQRVPLDEICSRLSRTEFGIRYRTYQLRIGYML